VIKLGFIGGLLAVFYVFYQKVKNFFLDRQIKQDEEKVAETNTAIATENNTINQDEEKLNEAIDNYNKSKSDSDSGNPNQPR
jgi:hypothetical protein